MLHSQLDFLFVSGRLNTTREAQQLSTKSISLCCPEREGEGITTYPPAHPPAVTAPTCPDPLLRAGEGVGSKIWMLLKTPNWMCLWRQFRQFMVAASLPSTRQFNKYFTRVNYSFSQIRWTIHRLLASMHCFQNRLAYFATIVSYVCKMFIAPSPSVNAIKRFLWL